MDTQQSIKGMTCGQLNALLQHVTCRPGMHFTVEQYNPYLYLHYHITVPNTYHPGEQASLHMHKAVPEFLVTVEDFFDWCLGTALWFDQHEGREWFKVDGRPWRDPHAYLGATDPFRDRDVFDRVVAMRPHTDDSAVVLVTF